jgi:autotransporter adhesin
MGEGALASSDYSNAIGYKATTNGDDSNAIGFKATANGDSNAIGANAAASGIHSIAMGGKATASSTFTNAIGYGTTASGDSSNAIGYEAIASGIQSNAIGESAEASGFMSNAIGLVAKASTSGSSAFGSYATASGWASSAFGYAANASNYNSVALGNDSATTAVHTDTTAQQAVLGGITYTYAGLASDTNGTVSVGIAGAERQIQNVAAGDVSATSTDAINGSQLYATNTALTNLDAVAVKYDDSNHKNITLNNTKITNVAPGDISATSTDAVNGSQLYSVTQNINQNISGLSQGLSDLDNRVDHVGAAAAALAGLHPLDFDPDDKWDFAAGFGHYKGTSAGAIGAFYRPNEDLMFSIGGTMGAEQMWNAGFTVKLGQGNHISTSRVAMAKEMKAMRKEIESLRSARTDVSASRQLDPMKMKLFPDVPQNHWAYKEIATLAGNGMLEGYPDGDFKGDRMMTRYEYATVLYRAMQNGANISQRLLNEFEPELERVRVDVVSKHKNGTPDIERVRVISGRAK